MSDDTSSSLSLVVAPSAEPLTLAQAKTYLRIEHSADDEAVTRAISAARVAAEQHLRVSLLPQTWDYSIANPSSIRLCLSKGPAQSIVGITLTTESGASSTMNAENYRLSVDGFSVLFTTAISIEKMTIRYVAGVANAVADIPAAIIQGMLHHVTVIFENRNGDVLLPMQAIACYEPFRRISL